MASGSGARRVFVASGALQRELEPFALPPLPPLSPLLGREQVLERCVAQLQSERFLTIEGMPGVGKTALARHVAEQLGLTVLLVNAHAGLTEQVEHWLTVTASGLANQGDRRMWEVQEFERQYARPVSLVIKLCYLLEALRDQPVLLWVDNAHLLFQEPQALGIFANIRSDLRFRSSYRCAVMLSGLSFPGELNDYLPTTIEGMDLQSAQVLLSTLVTPEALAPEWAALWEDLRRDLPSYVGGHPGLLVQTVRGLRSGLMYPPEEPQLRNLLLERPLFGYLLEHFWQPLSLELRGAIRQLVQSDQRSWSRSEVLELLVSLNPQPYLLLSRLYSDHITVYDPPTRKLALVPALADFWHMVAH